MRKTILIAMMYSLCSCVEGQSWVPVGSGDGINGIVYSICSFDSVLFAGGNGFDSAGGVYIPGKYIAQYNGTTWSPIPNSQNYIKGTVYTMIVYQGKLYVGGWFSTTGVYCWNGASWSEPFGTSATVRTFTVYNGNLILGGDFTSVSGIGTTDYIAQWNGTTTSMVGLGTEFDNSILALTTYNSNLIAGGIFGYSSQGVAQWNGTAWSSIGSSGPGAAVQSLITYSGDLYAGTQSGGNLWSWNGSTWSYTTTGAPDGVETMFIYNGELLAGGGFNSIGSYTVHNAGLFNGSTWSSPATNSLGADPYSFTLFNGDLYAGGEFTSASGNTRVRGVAVLSLPTGTITLPDNAGRFTLYPNPNNGVFSIEANGLSGTGSLHIYNMLGKEVYNTVLMNGVNNIDMCAEPMGIYIYRIQSEDGKSLGNGKFISE